MVTASKITDPNDVGMSFFLVVLLLQDAVCWQDSVLQLRHFPDKIFFPCVGSGEILTHDKILPLSNMEPKMVPSEARNEAQSPEQPTERGNNSQK